MHNPTVGQVRHAVSILSGIYKRADKLGNENGEISKKEIKTIIDANNGDESFAKSLKSVHRYAVRQEKKHGNAAVSVDRLNKTLGKVARYTIRRDEDKSGDFDATEQKGMPATFRDVMKFGQIADGRSLDSFVGE